MLRLETEGASEPLIIEAELVFNSIPQWLGKEHAEGRESISAAASKFDNRVVNLLQHFKGITIESSGLSLDTSRANLMDFRTNQKQGTSFFYVLPLSPTKALVEYTLFTPSLLTPAEYDAALKQYVTDTLGLSSFQVLEEEFGIIPMTNYRFPFYQQGIFNIGTAGGQTKGSSGYTFRFIQKRADQLASVLISDLNWSGVVKKLQALSYTPARFHFYDNVLLNVLWHQYLPGDKVFTRLFERNPAHQVFRFLDNETTLPEELRIISSLPTWPFLKAAMKSL
jgi:lycopene beta-cyclase